MKSVSELHFRVCDKGLFQSLAHRLAREVGRVSYYTPTEKPFPVLRDRYGDGFEDIERACSIYEDKTSVDCYCFPDVGFCCEQEDLRSQGFPVWGSGFADKLELMRGKFLDVLEQRTDLPVPPHERINGGQALLRHLAGKQDLYIKTSRFRGDWETMHWRSAEEDLDEVQSRLLKIGPLRERVVFYVFEPIETDIEDGCDQWCIDGQIPETIIHGMELKDKGYLGTFQRFKDLPEEVRCVSEQFAPILGDYGYRNFFSTEVRIEKDSGKSFFIDPTLRAGSPPHQVMCEMIGNLAEIIWQGAQGKLVEAEPAAKFGVQVRMDIGRDENNWTALRLPEELKRWVKQAQVIGGDDGIILAPANPDKTGCEDWLVGIGDTIEETLAHLRHNMELLPDGVSCEYAGLAELLKEVHSAEDNGMEFTDQKVPEPAIILEDK